MVTSLDIFAYNELQCMQNFTFYMFYVSNWYLWHIMPSRNHPMWLQCVGFITKPFSIHTHHLYDYISTRYHEQLTTNWHLQHDLFFGTSNFLWSCRSKQWKKSNGNKTINMSKTTYVVYFIWNKYFCSMLNPVIVDLYGILLVLSIYCSIKHQ